MAGEPFKECFDPNLKVQLWVWYSICLDRLGRIAIFPIEKWRVISRSSVVEERRIRFAQTFDACQTVRLEIEIFSLRNRERERERESFIRISYWQRYQIKSSDRSSNCERRINSLLKNIGFDSRSNEFLRVSIDLGKKRAREERC